VSPFPAYRFTLASSTVAGLALLAVGVLVAAHLVGRRRRRLLVSTADTWALAQGRPRRMALGWRVQGWLRLLLQVAVALLLVLALGEPRRAPEPGARAIALLLDASASMGAVAEGGSRLQRAREEAAAIVGGLAPGDRVLVAAFGRRLQLELAPSDDREAIRRALDRVQVGPETDDVAEAVSAAAELLDPGWQREIVVLGDHPPPPAALRALTARVGGVPVEYRPVGSPVDNVGISAFALQPGTDQGQPPEAVVTIHTSWGRAHPVLVELLALPSGRSIGRRTIQLPPAGTATARWPWTPGGADRVLRAVLRDPPAGSGNALALDDEASLTVPAAHRRRVLLVSPGNLYLEGALRSFGEGLVVERQPPERMGTELAAYDVIIFDGVTPGTPPRAGRIVMFDPGGPGSPFATAGTVRDPVPTELRREHPLLRHVSLADLNIREARRLTLGPSDVAVASALGAPLIVAREAPGLRLVAFAFDLRRSDLPLRPSLPLLLANALDWLTGGSEAAGPTAGAAIIDPVEADTGAGPGAQARPAGAIESSRRPHAPGDWLLLMAFLLGLAEWWSQRRRWTA
jgi:hypothetical protein